MLMQEMPKHNRWDSLIQILKIIKIYKRQLRTYQTRIIHIRASQILYKYVLRRSKNQQIRLSITEIISTAKTP